MVAIKAAHIKLTMKDLWPGAPWTWEDTLRIQDECRQRVIDSGETDYLRIQFLSAKEWEKYINSMPRYSDKQQILKSIYPEKKLYGLSLSEDEIEYLLEKLHGVNDEIGQNILHKLERISKNE